MSDPRSHFVNVLKFWRAIETFTLPDVPPMKSNDGKAYIQLEPGELLPWLDETMIPSEGKQWKHTLHFHCFPKVQVTKALIKLAPHTSDEFLEPQPGTTCLASLVVDHQGLALERTYVRSAFLYGLRILEAAGDPETLNELLQKAEAEFPLRFQAEKEAGKETDKLAGTVQGNREEESSLSNPPVTWTMLETELADLQQLAGDTLPAEASIYCVSEEITLQANPEASFMNTFYLGSLNYLINHPDDLGLPLETFLSHEIDTEKRSDLLTPNMMLASLDPGMLSPGRWPASPEYGLYSAQMAALNLTLAPLRKNAGLMGINGPPGTGKTTLVREVIVDVVVARAKRLLKADVDQLFLTKRHGVTDYDYYYEINDNSLFSGDGIVVASNNNAAVENISRELPLLKNIDMETFAGAGYFPAVAQNLGKENKCWGLLSAVLGNADKKKDFVKDFWRKGKHFNAYLEAQYDLKDPTKTQEHRKQYDKVAGELDELLKAYEEFQSAACACDEFLVELLSDEETSEGNVQQLKKLATTLRDDYNIPAANLPGPDFLSLSMEEIHPLTPYSSKVLNTLRSDIFLKSLELIECAIHVNAKYFRSNLNSFMTLLGGKLVHLIDEKVTAMLWNTFFFCVPVVSTTLASVEPLFAKMGQGSIGWLLLDEAGQATPQSACGAIWRATRCIIIGDTLQIPPVVTIPEGLGKLLQDKYDLEDPHWSPLHSSAQLLADRATTFGTYVRVTGGEVWTGTPLRAHRRCDDPMFTLSNKIAYNGQMVKVTAGSPPGGPLPASCWFDVKGAELAAGNVITADVQALEEIVTRIHPDVEGDIFAISPFRSVSQYCDTRITRKKQLHLHFGTIHTFQGKEADVVFLVLGMTRTNGGARAWASAMPNLLNVAVTRARKRFYVIGDYELWREYPYFEELAGILPRRAYQISTLF